MADEPRNGQDTLDIAAKQAIIERDQLKLELASARAELDATKKALVAAQDMIEQEQRGKMIPVILANTKMLKHEVEAMDTRTMFNLTETFRLLRNPVAGVKPEADEAASQGRRTVPPIFRYGPRGGEA